MDTTLNQAQRTADEELALSRQRLADTRSALASMHPHLVNDLAEFLVHAGWVPAELDGLAGDPEFTAEVQAAMRTRLAAQEAS